MTAFPSEDLGEAEDLWLIPPIEYSISEGSRVIPLPFRSRSMTQKLRTDQTGKLLLKASSVSESREPGWD